MFRRSSPFPRVPNQRNKLIEISIIRVPPPHPQEEFIRVPGHNQRNRLMEICIEVLDFFSRRKKVVVLLHLQRSAAFFEDQDKRTW